ncbi:MAG TPA: hypothetical protein DDX71_03795 [Ruminococcus sp.]|nr:hypothetical protein [Ruminococcus sp.]
MKQIKRMLAMLSALTLAFSLTACGETEQSEGRTKSEDDVAIATDNVSNTGDPDITGQEICWLAPYDLNPTGNADRSVAVSLLEDVYGAHIKYIATTSDSKFDDLANLINSGDQVDMFPYEWDAVPNGVTKGMYDPLDDYIDLSDPIWDGTRDIAETFKYNGHYYVVPFATSDPLAITYSREMISEEGLKDPYTLYQKGEWNWNTFMDMMKQFVNAAEGGETRYGICGWFGQAITQSTGDTIVKYDGSKFSNNIMSANIERAELLQEEISKLGLYDPTWYGNFPTDGKILFYGMAPWHLADSNAKNPDADLFVVPFPKDPESKDYNLCMNYGAVMLVKNSKRGDAVATYIKCARLAETDPKFKAAAKEKALIQSVNAQGKVTGYITEEQYDFMQTWYDPANIKPMFDFGYGMGTLMYNETYDYSTRGVMNNCADAILNQAQYEGTPDTWAEIRSQWSSVVDTVVAEYNAKN